MTLDWSQAWDWMSSNWQGVVAVAALIVAGYEMAVTRRHNRLSVTPHLDVFLHYWTDRVERNDTENSSKQRRTYQFAAARLWNKGIGPGRIKRFEVLKNGNLIKEFHKHAQKEIGGLFGPDLLVVKATKLGVGWLMAAGEYQDLLIIRCPITDGNERDDMEARLKNLSLWIEYESLYRKFFVYDSSKDGEACHAAGGRARLYAWCHRWC